MIVQMMEGVPSPPPPHLPTAICSLLAAAHNRIIAHEAVSLMGSANIPGSTRHARHCVSIPLQLRAAKHARRLLQHSARSTTRPFFSFLAHPHLAARWRTSYTFRILPQCAYAALRCRAVMNAPLCGTAQQPRLQQAHRPARMPP